MCSMARLYLGSGGSVFSRISDRKYLLDGKCLGFTVYALKQKSKQFAMWGVQAVKKFP